jgi:hypothetical protein
MHKMCHQNVIYNALAYVRASDITGSTSGAETAYTSEAHAYNPVFGGASCSLYL